MRYSVALAFCSSLFFCRFQFSPFLFFFAVLQDVLEKRMIEVEGALLRLQEQFHKVSIPLPTQPPLSPPLSRMWVDAS